MSFDYDQGDPDNQIRALGDRLTELESQLEDADQVTKDAIGHATAGLQAELECAQAFHNLAVKERDLARAQFDALRTRLDILRRQWIGEKTVRTNTKQPAQAALLQIVIEQLDAVLKM